MKPDERAVVDAFHRLYYEGPAGEERPHKRTRWMGYPCLKCPLDLWIYQELIVELRPRLIVETGTYFGGSALFLAQVLDALGEGEVVTIDVEERSPRATHPRIRYVRGSSADPAVVEAALGGREAGLVILDSDHSRAHVAAELALLAPRVRVGGYLIVEDSNVNGHPVWPHYGDGPFEAVRDFLPGHPEFAVDAEREKFLLTYNPGGYLKRIR
ncbi:MAG TPA: CmcI family methyltransferase [Thermoanaerobaculia bacterium]|jgi:cephalosporin hydroxylase